MQFSCRELAVRERLFLKDFQGIESAAVSISHTHGVADCYSAESNQHSALSISLKSRILGSPLLLMSVISTDSEGSRNAGDRRGVERSRGCVLCHADTRRSLQSARAIPLPDARRTS